MIGYLEGEVRFVEENYLILNVNGVGYKVWVTQEDIRACAIGSEKAFFVESVIREDAFDLYGFLDASGQEMFKKLRSVKGVGPKSSLNILALGIEDVRSAIVSQDVKFLTKANGLGKKGAERIILELQNTLPSTLNLDRQHKAISDNIMAGLVGLGYSQKQVREVLSGIPDDVQKDEDVVKFFLQNI